MFKPALVLLILTTSTNSYHSSEQFILDGDYTEQAREAMIKNKPYEPFDPNDILYKAIIKELEEEENH